MRALGSARLGGKWRASAGTAAGQTLLSPLPDLWVLRTCLSATLMPSDRRPVKRRSIPLNAAADPKVAALYHSASRDS